VEDSPNSAAVVADAIRCCKLARDAGMAGPIDPVSAWCMKHPPTQMFDRDAKLAFEEFLTDAVSRIRSGSLARSGS
jgi:myo-inositol-1-phosphate synthase